MARTCPNCGNAYRDDPAHHKPKTKNGSVVGVQCLRNTQRMQIDQTNEKPPRELRVQVPGELYDQLWGLKLLDGTEIRQMVTTALEHYVDDRLDQEP